MAQTGPTRGAAGRGPGGAGRDPYAGRASAGEQLSHLLVDEGGGALGHET